MDPSRATPVLCWRKNPPGRAARGSAERCPGRAQLWPPSFSITKGARGQQCPLSHPSVSHPSVLPGALGMPKVKGTQEQSRLNKSRCSQPPCTAAALCPPVSPVPPPSRYGGSDTPKNTPLHPKASRCFPDCPNDPPRTTPSLSPRCPQGPLWPSLLSGGGVSVPRSPPTTSQSTADGGGDICLRVTHLTVTVSPPYCFTETPRPPPHRRVPPPPHNPPMAHLPPHPNPSPRGNPKGEHPPLRGEGRDFGVWGGGGTGDSCSFSVFCLN